MHILTSNSVGFLKKIKIVMVTYQDNPLCLFADMASKINKRCDEKNLYVAFEMTEVLVDTHCTYKNLVKLLIDKIFFGVANAQHCGRVPNSGRIT